MSVDLNELTHWGLETHMQWLTHLPLDKMAAILAEENFKCSFLNENEFEFH